MASDSIIYEQPLNERIRMLLRLEYLFNRVAGALRINSVQKNQDTIDGLLNILSAFERSDLKLEIIKELDRLASNLSELTNTQGVDKKKLDVLLVKLDQALNALHSNEANIGQKLRENHLLQHIRQRSSILGGGSCNIDIPAYYFWLEHTPVELRQQQLNNWFQQFSTARTAVDIALQLIRNSSSFCSILAEAGFYQKALDSKLPNQLVRVKLSKSFAYYPEISGGKHRFTIRFMYLNDEQQAIQISEDKHFLLSCCCV